MVTGNFPTEPSTTLLAADTSSGFPSNYVKTFYMGQGAGIPNAFNYDAGYLEHLSFWCAPNGIVQGLNITRVSNNVNISEGLALIGGFVPSGVWTEAIPAEGVTKFYFLANDGTITSATGSTPPAESLYLGSVSTRGGEIVVSQINVLKIVNRASIVRTTDLGYPSLDYGADFVVTLGGIYNSINGKYTLCNPIELPSVVNYYALPQYMTYSTPVGMAFTVIGDLFITGDFYAF